MRGARLLFAIVAALAAGACARQQPVYYAMDPNTGQPVRVAAQQGRSIRKYRERRVPLRRIARFA